MMKKIFLCTLSIILLSNLLFAQKPPYPIIFVHGWAGNDSTWVNDENGNWEEFLSGINSNINWVKGGTINICLNMTFDTIPDNALDDIEFIPDNEHPLQAGNFYFVNFQVNKHHKFHPKNVFGVEGTGPLQQITATQTTLEIDPSKPCENIQINDMISIDNEIMEVTGINYNGVIVESITVRRNNAFNTQSVAHYEIPTFGDFITTFNLSNESNQSSIIRGGFGIKTAINKVKILTGAEKVILVAHSMGGLNSRQYIQNTDLYEDDVAKLVTICTPHQGSNKSNIPTIIAEILGLKYNIRSSAVRDMRYRILAESGPPSNDDDAPFLYGGNENIIWANILNFYNNDFNGDGDDEESDLITGLNEKVWPASGEILIHFIVGQRSGADDDDIVRWDRQILPMDMLVNVAESNIEASFIEMPEYYFGVVHTEVHKQIEKCLIGLDEPDTYEYAYTVLANNGLYNGFVTNQISDDPIDEDWFKFEADITGTATVNFDPGIQYQWYVEAYKYDNNSLVYQESINHQSGTTNFDFDVVQGFEYYLYILSSVESESWKNPYSFEINTAANPVLTTIELSAGSYTTNINEPVNILAVALDDQNNPMPNISLTFSSNNTGYFQGSNPTTTNQYGEATITYIPTATGNHMITATAENNVSGQLPDPISVSDPDSGHDIAVQYLQISPTQVDPGDNVHVTVQVNNYGIYTEYNIPVVFTLYKPNGQQCDQETAIIPSLNPSGVTSVDKYLTTTSTEGFYNIHVEATNSSDEDYSNNFVSGNVYVGDPQDSEEYETQADFLEGGGDCHELYGVNICLQGANPSEAYFIINGQNINVDIDHIKLLWGGTHIIAYDTYYNSSFGSVYYYFGPASIELTITPGTGVCLQGQTIQYDVTAPNGWDFINNNYQEFSFIGPGGNDNTYFEQWLEFEESISDNHIVYNCNIPNDATPRTYAAWIGNDIRKPNNSPPPNFIDVTLFKLWRLQVVEDFHDLASNITQPTNNEMFTVGDQVQINYEVINNGQSNETGYVELRINGPGGYELIETNNIYVNGGQIYPLQFLWDTQGLPTGQYTIESEVTIPDDDNPGNNSHLINIDLQTDHILDADFSGNPTTGEAPLLVCFIDLSEATNTTITSWLWDFGDGGTSTSQNPCNIYQNAGNYTVTLTVSDGLINDSETKTDYIIVTEPSILDLEVYLEGPFNGSNMTPFPDYTDFPMVQPYTAAPWNYSGTESLVTIPNYNIVDWVLLEFRDAADVLSATSSTTIHRQAALLLDNGRIVGMDGQSDLEFDQTYTQNLYLVVFHRNHLGIISSQPLTETYGVYSYDFTTGSDKAYGGILAQKELSANIWGMIGADGDASGTVDLLDKDVWSLIVGESGYLSGDFNLNGEVENADKNDVWLPSLGSSTQIPDTNTFTCGDQLIDTRDDQSYNTIQIGTQCWMAENLTIGIMIDGTEDQTQNTPTEIIEKYCYGNNTSNCDTYGGLYQWNEMMQYTTTQGAQGICPPNWHLPTDEEWKQLEGEVDSLYGYPDTEWDGEGYRGYDAGLNLKSESGWNPGGNGNDSFGFTGLPGGFRQYSNGSFSSLGYGGYWWLMSETSGSTAWTRNLNWDTDEVFRQDFDKDYGFSVRCLKDETTNQPPTQPSNPSPDNGATEQPVNTTLSWTCTDPENDPLTYDVYFSETNPPVLVSSGQTANIHDPGTLNYNLTYYWKILAHDDNTNSTNGPVWNFTTVTQTWSCGDDLLDTRDGQIYNTILIGTQCWMVENLNIGDMISGNQDMSDDGDFEKYCFNNNVSSCNTYGGLYQWNELMQYSTTPGIQGICPEGWHVPTDSEWCTLENYVDAGSVSCSATGYRGIDCGLNLKSITMWNGTDLYGFTALPGGFRGIDAQFYYQGISAMFWSSNSSGNSAWLRDLYSGQDNINRTDYHSKPNGMAVRCVKN
ncbi:MAG: PKD domain-containing protein [Bacteroidetes bacterium]|nr:PKD domain-containing protein [Bacteroidota bacterium]MBL7104202.1 PKD domain-containing protein [Bacteroidales bacterium]